MKTLKDQLRERTKLWWSFINSNVSLYSMRVLSWVGFGAGCYTLADPTVHYNPNQVAVLMGASWVNLGLFLWAGIQLRKKKGKKPNGP